MSSKASFTNTSVKLSAEDMERIDALIEPMARAARDVGIGNSVSRTSVVRAAILRGVEELERRFPPKGPSTDAEEQ